MVANLLELTAAIVSRVPRAEFEKRISALAKTAIAAAYFAS